MGCKLLEIMADGTYAVFHQFEAFLKKRLTHKQCLLDGHPSAVVLLQSLLFLLQPLKQAPAGLLAPSSPWPAVLPRRPHRPSYSHRSPSHPSTHRHLLLFSGNGRRTSKPSYRRTPPHVGNNC